jgi:hypothetical protein
VLLAGLAEFPRRHSGFFFEPARKITPIAHADPDANRPDSQARSFQKLARAPQTQAAQICVRCDSAARFEEPETDEWRQAGTRSHVDERDVLKCMIFDEALDALHPQPARSPRLRLAERLRGDEVEKLEHARIELILTSPHNRAVQATRNIDRQGLAREERRIVFVKRVFAQTRDNVAVIRTSIVPATVTIPFETRHQQPGIDEFNAAVPVKIPATARRLNENVHFKGFIFNDVRPAPRIVVVFVDGTQA